MLGKGVEGDCVFELGFDMLGWVRGYEVVLIVWVVIGIERKGVGFGFNFGMVGVIEIGVEGVLNDEDMV